MAIMHPIQIESRAKATKSEILIFNELKKQLTNDYHVFYSVTWASKDLLGIRKNSEIDFLVYNSNYGYLALEVKGGTSLIHDDEGWFLFNRDDTKRKLDRSPWEQAEEGMYFLKEAYREEYHETYKGAYGAIAVFPFFSISDESRLYGNRVKEMTIDFHDIHNLKAKIEAAYRYWIGRGNSDRLSAELQKNKFFNLIEKKFAISACAGALIQDVESKIETINRVQKNYLYFIKNYDKAFIVGGAGTGKTWIAMKMANEMFDLGKKVLITFYSNELVEFYKSHINNDSIDIIDYDNLLLRNNVPEEKFGNAYANVLDYIKVKDKYDCIIIDEGQDFNENMALSILIFLNDFQKSNLYVFYDTTQNVYRRDFREAFDIKYPAFILKENLRNTSNIYNYAKVKTELGTDVITNDINGPIPEKKVFRNFIDGLSFLETEINNLVLKQEVYNEYITILVDDRLYQSVYNSKIGNWENISKQKVNKKQLRIYKTSSFKGLESNIVFYIRTEEHNLVYDYVAYTRARYFLYEIVIQNF